MLCENPTGHSNGTKKLKSEAQATNKGETERKLQVLEAELMEIRERYLHISLKYAESEAQREQLQLKMKASNERRSWF